MNIEERERVLQKQLDIAIERLKHPTSPAEEEAILRHVVAVQAERAELHRETMTP